MGRFASINVKDYGAAGSGTVDDTQEIQAALDAAATLITSNVLGARVIIPIGRYIVKSTLVIKDGVQLVGEAKRGSVLWFIPTASDTCIEMGDGSAQNANNVVRNLEIRSTTTGYNKVGIHVIDCSHALVDNVFIRFADVADNLDDIGIKLSGRDNCTFSNLAIYAPVPIHVTATGGTDSDNVNFENCYLESSPAPDTMTRCIVLIDATTTASHLVFGGRQAWVKGDYGLRYDCNVSPSDLPTVRLSNVRMEQATSNTGYSVYANCTAGDLKIVLDSCKTSPECGGVYARNCRVYAHDTVFRRAAGSGAVADAINADDATLSRYGCILQDEDAVVVGDGTTSRIDSSVIDVTAFGATGDGVTDDTAAIQAALDACQALSDNLGVPVDVVFPPGEYYITTALSLPAQGGSTDGDLNPRWKVSGYGATILTDQNISLFYYDGSETYDHNYWVPTIEGFQFEGDHNWQTNVQNVQYGINYNDSYSMAIRDCTFQNLRQGILGTFCLATKIDSCRFNQCSDGIYLTGGGTYQSIDNCRFDMYDPEGQAIVGNNFHATNIIVEGSRCKYPIVAGVSTGTANHVLVDHFHFECVDGCLHLLRCRGQRDYTTELRSVQVAAGDYLLLDATNTNDGHSIRIDGIGGVPPSVDAYNAGTTYAIGQRVIYSGNVYTSLQSSNTGNTPDSEPTWWQDDGTGEICRGPQTVHYALKGAITTSVRDWTPEAFWTDATEWDNGLPRFLEYDGANMNNNAGMISLRSYEDDGTVTDQDATPDISSRQYWKTGNTVATTITDFDFADTYHYYRSQLPLVIVVGDDLTTFAHKDGGSGTKLILTGGQDYKASENDVLEFRRVGTTGPWVQVGGPFAGSQGQPINVLDYGATGDGVTDDTAAIQAALDAAPNGGTVLFPTARYAIASTINVNKNVILQGEGIGTDSVPTQGSQLYWTGGTSDIMVHVNTGTGATVHGWSIRDMTIQGNNTSGITGIVLGAGSLGTPRAAVGSLRNLLVSACTTGIECRNAQLSQFEYIHVRNCTDGILFADATDNANTTCHVTACRLKNNTRGLKIEKLTDSMFDNLTAEENDDEGILINGPSAGGNIDNLVFNVSHLENNIQASPGTGKSQIKVTSSGYTTSPRITFNHPRFGTTPTSDYDMDLAGARIIVRYPDCDEGGIIRDNANADTDVVIESLDSASEWTLSNGGNDNIVTHRRHQAKVSTTDATVTTLDTVPTANDVVYHVTADVVATETTDHDEAASYRLAATFKNDGGTLSRIGTDTMLHEKEDTAGWDCELDASGTNIRVRVTGAASTNVNWFGVIEVMEVA